MGPRTTLGNSPVKGTCCRVRPGTLTPKRHISPRPCERGIRGDGFSRFTRRYKGIPVGSFPPLIICLNSA
ncbi:hypothetical protein JTE90_028035, partial [Oedothorax gibbosus]